MPYETQVSSVNPRLLILLTDESEESVWVINRLIDQQSQLNFDGEAPKNRCFISVISYNYHAKELCSGWIRDLDMNPLRYKKCKKLFPDGDGGIAEFEVVQPIWIEPSNNPATLDCYTEAIKMAEEYSVEWIKSHSLSPIVLDCSTNCNVEYAKDEIESMKAISAKDGNILFFGCYSDERCFDNDVFSRIPKEWGYEFSRVGLFDNHNLFSIIDNLRYYI